jgi:hypothetical protein
MNAHSQTCAQPKTYIVLPFNFWVMLNPTVQCFPDNSVSEGNTMIVNSSGFFQVKKRNTSNFNSSHCNPEDQKISTTETKNGVENLKHRDRL